MENTLPHYRRVLLKLSGEALAAGGEGILNFDFIGSVAEVV
jgi:uridylate kinase